MGQLLHYQFRGLLSVHSCYNLQTRRIALCDPFHRRLQRLRCLHRCSDCYRVERSSSRAGLSSRCGPAPFTAHCNRLISAVGLGTYCSAANILTIGVAMDFNQNDALEMYRREVAKVQPLTDEEQAHLFQGAGKPGEQGELAKRRLLESTLHLVLPIAERHVSSGLSMLDLRSEERRV